MGAAGDDPLKRRDSTSRTVRHPKLLPVLGVCLLAAAALFGGYEVVERTWLAGVDPEVLRTLHLVRGFSTATIVAVLAMVLLLRQLADPGVKEEAPPARGTWKRRLQHVSLRTKIVVPMVGLAVVPTLSVGTFAVLRNLESLRESVVSRIEFDTATKAEAMRQFFQMVRQDLVFLSHIKALRDLAEAPPGLAGKHVADQRAAVERELHIFSQGKRAYYQVRYLNTAGLEVVRLNVENGLPGIVPTALLQDKSDRYYVKAALALAPGSIYISEMDLNVEHGKIEVPHRGVIRFATHVLGGDGVVRGLVVINIFANFLGSLVGPLPPGTEAWLLAEDGTYLSYIGDSEQRRELFGLEKQRNIAADFSREDISILFGNRNGRHTIRTARAMVSAAGVPFEEGNPHQHWRLLIAHPRRFLEAPFRYLLTFLSVVTVLVASLAGVIGILVGHYLARPVASLRLATKEIAAGNLSRRLSIETGDEIEALAMDFNSMTEKLREARARQSAWNAELQAEVARQKDQLRQLQSGLARADKMASIGQMTASVMHEIGNPLAAMKTKIQVAEEEGNLQVGCQALLSEVLKEVDRLATFLRSFARLARLREPVIKEVALADVVRGVVELVTLDLRRRRLTLRVESPADIPMIRGDADQLRQVVINLILNAAEASSDGGEILVLVQRMAQGGDEKGAAGSVIIGVTDHGSGMSPDLLGKVGTPFYTTKPEGTGLGLAICRQIVHDHGGKMQIRSIPGEGTTVTLAFPVHEEPTGTPQVETAS